MTYGILVKGTHEAYGSSEPTDQLIATRIVKTRVNAKRKDIQEEIVLVA